MGVRPGAAEKSKAVTMTPQEVEGHSKQSAVQRLASLPLVSSTCLLLSVVYCAAKETHPYVKSLCEATESGVKTIASLAAPSITPVVNRLQPQIDSANDVACKCLDKVEEALPILNQPLEQVLANPSGVLAQARNGRVVVVDGAKHTLTVVLNKAGVMLQEAVGLTKALVDGSVKALSGSPVVHFSSEAFTLVLAKCETLMGFYLGLPEEQLGKADGTVKDPETTPKKQSSCRLLSSISTRLRKKPTCQEAARDQGNKVHSNSGGSAVKQPVRRELRNSLPMPDSKQPQSSRWVKRSLVY
ncbi:hypothetical protein Z043_117993 [Scleropages formosus]|nr:hypothetical protein Z043_117993 [Scleropages formosus]